MKYDDDENVSEKDKEPGPEVTRRRFRKWQIARRGTKIAEDMTNPVWQWMFLGRVDPYHANEKFKGAFRRLFGRVDFPNQPRWAGCRLGRSQTKLADGRVFWIAGEHEDFYDPDFYIYNDVIVQHPDGRIQIIGYPSSTFRPTDFHSATAINGDRSILLIGSLGYPEDRQAERTQVYLLDTETLAIVEIESKGSPPSWIHEHEATLDEDNHSITVCGGKVLSDHGLVENIDDWSLSLSNYEWTRLTKRDWPRFRVSRVDGESLHLWQYGLRQLNQDPLPTVCGPSESLAAELGCEPNVDAFHQLFTPPTKHTVVERDLETEEDWLSTHIVINDTVVRYHDDMSDISVIVKGSLPKPLVEIIAADLESKLALVENTECRTDWIE